MLYCHLLIHAEIHIYILGKYWHNDKRHIKEDARGRHRKKWRNKTSLEIFSHLTLLQVFERLACERMLETERELHILTPLLWPSRCVVLVLLMLESTPLGLSEGPLGRVWLSLPHLVSSYLELYWQLHRGFPRTPSVGCCLPYHIWFLLSGILLTTASGVSEVPLGRVWPSYHIWSLMSGTLLATASGVSEVPLGRVWPSLPLVVSNSLGVC